VISKQLCANATCQTVPVLIYASARTGPLPSLNALASVVLLASTTLIALAYAVYRRSARRSAPSRGGTLALPI
jgi:ABC-type spermidine/putrescine transport system permease subunit II